MPVVGTLVEVGRHRMSIEEFKKIVDGGTRSDAGESMSRQCICSFGI